MDPHLNDDDQWEVLRRWLRDNRAWILAGIIVGVGGVLGYRGWQSYVTQRAEAAATEFAELQAALDNNDTARVTELAAQLRDEYSSTPYADHAELILARLDVESGEYDRAAQRLKTVADRTDDDYLAELARLRLARVQIAQNKPDEALATLGKRKPGAFAAAFNEVKGDALLAKGDRKGAMEAYQDALSEAHMSGADTSQLQLKINDLAEPVPLEEAQS